MFAKLERIGMICYNLYPSFSNNAFSSAFDFSSSVSRSRRLFCSNVIPLLKYGVFFVKNTVGNSRYY